MSTAPGVHVTTELRGGPAGAPQIDGTTAFLIDLGLYGPLTPQTYTRNADIPTKGANIPVVAGLTTAAIVAAGRAGVASFFEEGGTRLVMVRATGEDPVAARLVLLDDDDDPVITIRAKYVGAYGNRLTVTVAAGTDDDTVKVTLAAADALDGILEDPVVLDNLADATAIAAAIAANPIAAADLDTVIATGAGTHVPALLAATHLATGDDGDFSNLGAEPFPPELGPGVIIDNIHTLAAETTGNPSAYAAILTSVAEAAEAGRRIVIMQGGASTSKGASPAADQYPDLGDNLTDIRDAMIDDLGEARADELLGYIGAIAPDVLVRSAAFGNLDLNPCLWVAAARARTVASEGPHRAPAGEPSIARTLLGPTLDGSTVDPIDVPTATLIDAAGINAVRIIAGTTRLYGWRSLSGSADWAQLSARDTVNMIAWEAGQAAEALTFRPIDAKGQLLAQLAGILTGVAEVAKAAGALFPRIDPADGVTELDPGYSVDTSANVNTAEALAAGTIAGTLAIRVAPTAAVVNIVITKAALTGAV